ncbi:hemerythrin domain-containing protein [Mycobacterium sp. AMU20-3851]|uniref:hemerythrin domain-containing protein n=1 Tax=Mycobacterium sp. AMU20-3851 TaxID=3122055 RepID=UPI003753F61E
MTDTSRSAQPARVANPELDLSGITLTHRAMVTDTSRLADLTTAVAQRRLPCPPRRARAIARYVTLMCESIHHHHTMEDDVLWPVIEAAAGDFVDLSELTEDHAALDPRLDRLRAAAAAFGRSGDPEMARPLAAGLADLHRLLNAHIADEERELFPVIRRYVSIQDWQAVEKAAQRTGRLSFDGPRILAVATDPERATLAAAVPAPLMMLLRCMAWRHRSFERAVFG